MNLIILGPPGSGKGTLSKLLVDRCEVVHLSTGDLFRENIGGGTELGRLAESYINKGDLVPDEVTNAMVKDRLAALAAAKGKEAGFLLDGFPRNLAQAEALAKMLEELNLKLDHVINVCLPDDLIVARLAGRRVCRQCGASYNTEFMPTAKAGVCDRCGGEVYQRSDDNEETVKNRLATYREQTEPLIEYYAKEGLLLDIDNSGAPAEAAAQLTAALAV